MALYHRVFNLSCLLFVADVLALVEKRPVLADPPPTRDPKELAKVPPYKRMLQGEDAKRVAGEVVAVEFEDAVEPFRLSSRFPCRSQVATTRWSLH